MWLFLPFGFFSVVFKDCAPASVLVRTRAREDLDRLIERLDVGGIQIKHTPDADYPYRAEIPRRSLTLLFECFLEDDLTYDNFKDEVARVGGPMRAMPLHDVWETMHAVEDYGARRKAKSNRKSPRALRRSV